MLITRLCWRCCSRRRHMWAWVSRRRFAGRRLRPPAWRVRFWTSCGRNREYGAEIRRWNGKSTTMSKLNRVSSFNTWIFMEKIEIISHKILMIRQIVWKKSRIWRRNGKSTTTSKLNRVSSFNTWLFMEKFEIISHDQEDNLLEMLVLHVTCNHGQQNW